MFRGPVCADTRGSRRRYRPTSACEPALLRASPGFLQPVGQRCGGTDKILHAHDDDGRLAAAVDDEALIALCSRDAAVHCDIPFKVGSDLDFEPDLDNLCGRYPEIGDREIGVEVHRREGMLPPTRPYRAL